MINRRSFLAATGVAGLAPVAGLAQAAETASAAGRDYYELRQYAIESDAQRKLFDKFLSEAAIPALNRLGVKPVGVFTEEEKPNEEKKPKVLFVLLRHKSLDVLSTIDDRLMADAEFVAKGAEFLNAPADAPVFKRLESSLMLAFKGMPELERPVTSPGRIFQLRTYESPSVKTGLKKIEMFNDAGEIALFRRVGLNPVFFGQTLVGGKMPNLTYMLTFNSVEEKDANWKKFITDPEWLKLRAMAEYSDKAILCGITNLVLKPTDYSQI
jgi:hypothetical protein